MKLELNVSNGHDKFAKSNQNFPLMELKNHMKIKIVIYLNKMKF